MEDQRRASLLEHTADDLERQNRFEDLMAGLQS